jgi:hypothetical protein
MTKIRVHQGCFFLFRQVVKLTCLYTKKIIKIFFKNLGDASIPYIIKIH